MTPIGNDSYEVTRQSVGGKINPLEFSRIFDSDGIDVDALAEVVRQLLASVPDEAPEDRHDTHLLLKRRRVSHVMGTEGAPAT
jgi:hypothetical protein